MYKPAQFFLYSRYFAPVSTRVVCNNVFDRLIALLVHYFLIVSVLGQMFQITPRFN